jgi:hypothetical protein
MLHIDAVRSCGTSMMICGITRRYIPEDNTLIEDSFDVIRPGTPQPLIGIFHCGFPATVLCVFGFLR